MAGGALLGSTEAHSASSQAVWDREFDVVVIGSGTGLVAALVAARAGKRVLRDSMTVKSRPCNIYASSPRGRPRRS